jgi:hypothetical protein
MAGRPDIKRFNAMMVLTKLDKAGGRVPLPRLKRIVRAVEWNWDEVAVWLDNRDCVLDGGDVLRMRTLECVPLAPERVPE